MPFESANAQMMSASDYQGFLKRLDATIPQWEKALTGLKVDELNIAYSVGSLIAENQRLALQKLAAMRPIIRTEYDHPRLSNEMSILDSLNDVTSELSRMSQFLPESQQTSKWIASTATPTVSDIAKFLSPLMDHVYAYADYLQARAEKCSQRNDNALEPH
ncbi:MAG TPA: hypothetical protein VEK84_18775 [Terriglobales bacterium]|nr:hypothetical protein [Terriglobales bacterium]